MHFKKQTAALMLAIIMAFSVFYIEPVHTEAATVTTQSNYDRWMDVCSTMLKNLKKYHFRYSNSGGKDTFKSAKKSSRKTNCALFVSWCLQEYGAVPKGTTFYTTGSGRIRKSNNFGKKDKIIRVHRKCSNVKLKPGDICCWNAHVNIYAGKSSSGKKLWYDGGKISTASNSNGSRYTHTSKHSYGYLNGRTISYIIRIKDL